MEPQRTPRFVDHVVDREERFSLGTEVASGRHVVSVAVAAQLVDYEEHHEISCVELAALLVDRSAAVAFVERCRAGGERHRLLGPG